MADTTIWTLRDVIEYLIDQLDVPLTGRNQRLARAAVLTAYRDLPNRYRWSAFQRRRLLITTDDYSTGTVTYDHTGGTYERELTLAGGTWPTDAAEGRVIISSVAYVIATRESDTVVTMEQNSNPGADVAAGTSYQWYRSTYALPVDFRKMLMLADVTNSRQIPMIGVDQLHVGSALMFDTPDTPTHACVRSAGDYYNSISLEFLPPPNAAIKYDYMYESAPRDLLIESYSTGTVSITAGETDVTGTDTVFPTDCVGSIIRFSSSAATAPTSIVGSPSSTVAAGVDNRFTAQRVITARASDTAVTVDSTVSSTLSGVKYVISDPIDLNVSSMFTALLRSAEAEFARLTSHKMAKDKQLDARHALIQAMESDQLTTYSTGSLAYDRFTNVTVSDSDGDSLSGLR